MSPDTQLIAQQPVASAEPGGSGVAITPAVYMLKEVAVTVSTLRALTWTACIVGCVNVAPSVGVRAEEADTTIRQQIRLTGAFERMVVARDNDMQLADLVGNAELIVEASTTPGRSFLSEDGADIHTDHTFKLHSVIKNTRLLGLRAGHSVTLRRESGALVVDGHPAVAYENEFPPFQPNQRYILFLMSRPGADVYTVLGGAKGAYLAGDNIRAVRISLDDAHRQTPAVPRAAFLGEVRALLRFTKR
jgi:hypothetical protein